jgi:hypothetical protein
MEPNIFFEFLRQTRAICVDQHAENYPPCTGTANSRLPVIWSKPRLIKRVQHQSFETPDVFDAFFFAA